MSSFKHINTSDIVVVPYNANKKYSYNYEYFSSDIKVISGSQVYNTINHLFYQKYTSSLDMGSLSRSNYYENTSQQRPTGSYVNYDYNSQIYKNFPTGSGEGITVLSISPSVYGNMIKPGTFILSSSTYNIQDDSNGNIKDNSTYVGNIYYSHGLVILTNQSYQTINTNSTCSFYNEHTIYINQIKCTIENDEFNLSYNPSLTDISGSIYNFTSSSVFTPYITTIGLYNDNMDLLMVAKVAQPIPLSQDTDFNILVRYDT